MRPIDADELMKRLNRKKAEPCNKRYTEGFNDALMRFRSMVHSAPTLSPDDVRPVGKWIEVAMRIKCSVCGTDFNDEVTCCSDCYRWPWNYCPNCGAKMKGAEAEHTMEEFMYGQEMGDPVCGSL